MYRFLRWKNVSNMTKYHMFMQQNLAELQYKC